jgi:hypothetical protein
VVTLLLQLRKEIGGAEPGTVHVIATDTAAPLDLPAWCHMTGHDYLTHHLRHAGLRNRPITGGRRLRRTPMIPAGEMGHRRFAEHSWSVDLDPLLVKLAGLAAGDAPGETADPTAARGVAVIAWGSMCQ